MDGLLAGLFGAVLVEPFMVKFQARPRRSSKRPFVPACLDQAIEPRKISVARARVAIGGMSAQEALDHIEAVGERNAPGYPAFRRMAKCEGWAKVMSAVNVADPAAVRREIQVLNRGHPFPC
jgi:hypothetical protein